MANVLTPGDPTALTYNGFTFDAKATQIIGLETIPTYDNAQRAVKYVTWKIKVKSVLTADAPPATCDALFLDNVRRKLTVPGAALSANNRGIGNFDINVTPDGMRDVCWGPRPLWLGHRFLGGMGGTGVGMRSIEFTWQVEVCIPECPTATFMNRIMAFTYKLAFSVDLAGYVTRTHTGEIEIPMTWTSVDDRRPPDTVDNYFEQVVPELPTGFERTTRDRTLSEDRRKLQYTIVDRMQPPQPLQDGVIECDASHTVQNQDRGFVQWLNRIDATYELTRDLHKGAAWQKFAALLRSRFLPGGSLFGVGQFALVNPRIILPVSLNMSDPEIFGRKAARFSFSYINIDNDNSLRRAFAINQLWVPVPSTSFSSWRASLGDVLHPRGLGQLRHFQSDDMILDLCIQRRPPRGFVFPSIRFPRLPNLSLPDFRLPPIRPDLSWLRYRLRLDVDLKGNSLRLKPLPNIRIRASDDNVPSELGTFQGIAVGTAPSGSRAPVRSTIDLESLAPPSGQVGGFDDTNAPRVPGAGQSWVPDIIQHNRTSPTITVTVSGSALRIGYPIPAPALRSFGGIKPVAIPARWRFVCETVANYGVPVYGAAWQITYLIPTVPNGGVPILANPELHTAEV